MHHRVNLSSLYQGGFPMWIISRLPRDEKHSFLVIVNLDHHSYRNPAIVRCNVRPVIGSFKFLSSHDDSDQNPSRHAHTLSRYFPPRAFLFQFPLHVWKEGWKSNMTTSVIWCGVGNERRIPAPLANMDGSNCSWSTYLPAWPRLGRESYAGIQMRN